jgi:hypothetical protein
MRSIGRAMGEGGEPIGVSRAVLAKLDAAADLLTDVVLNYATKDTS